MPTAFPLACVVGMVLLAALAVGLATAVLAELPLLAGGLLAGGAALGAWAGWRAGLARRPQPAVVPAPVRRRRPR
jgi:threonine/homoserine/homoserine lactone efflux protein